MDEARRWPAKAAVKKDDQFTAAPDFIDGHDSEHLPLRGRIGATWHGMSNGRRLVVLASIGLLATWGGTSAAFALDDLNSRGGGHSPGGGLAAEQDAPIDPVGPVPDGQAVEGLLNTTAPPVPSSPAPPPSAPAPLPSPLG